jgi:hypothetical protein
LKDSINQLTSIKVQAKNAKQEDLSFMESLLRAIRCCGGSQHVSPGGVRESAQFTRILDPSKLNDSLSSFFNGPIHNSFSSTIQHDYMRAMRAKEHPSFLRNWDTLIDSTNTPQLSCSNPPLNQRKPQVLNPVPRVT